MLFSIWLIMMIPNRAHIKDKKKTPGFSKNSAAGWLPTFLNTELVTHTRVLRVGLHLWL